MEETLEQGAVYGSEIERRWAIPYGCLPEELSSLNGDGQFSGTIDFNDDEVIHLHVHKLNSDSIIRFRTMDELPEGDPNKYVFTLKSGHGVKRTEIEQGITKEQYESLSKEIPEYSYYWTCMVVDHKTKENAEVMFEIKFIPKLNYSLPIGDSGIVDRMTQDMYILEVEFGSEEEAAAFKIEDYLTLEGTNIMEVTDNLDFTMSHIYTEKAR